MIDSVALTGVLKKHVVLLVDDLRLRADEVPEISDWVWSEWRDAFDAGRTAHDVETWREDLLSQVAVSWVLGCVFIRFCEDNRLLDEPMLSGVGQWRGRAEDEQTTFFRRYPEAGERRYLRHVFSEASKVHGLSEVFGVRNPVHSFGAGAGSLDLFGPSDDAARVLVELWRSIDSESGHLVWDFTDDSWDSRFLGDLYQDLSDHARKKYALLQTPDFVESFILDRTLEPAIEEFGLRGHDGSGFRIIDPACGSGHFLLGAFHRLADRHLVKDPSSGRRAAAASALGNIFGVDLNPFAVSIARFRLLVAALKFAEVKTLKEKPGFVFNLAAGNSLLYGPLDDRLPGMGAEVDRQTETYSHLYAMEDELVASFLKQKYHAVVANPPYITPKDPAENKAYRARFSACHRQYSLAVPFMQQLFALAVRSPGRPAGYVGQITANSFMKREFGKKLIEKYLTSEIDLTHVIDTSGAYIPGHGTPTVILVGRSRKPLRSQVRAVLGIRGEPSAPSDPADGKVWGSIVDLIDQPGAENEYVSTADIERSVLARHPWSLQGGSAGPLKDRVESLAGRCLKDLKPDVGFGAVTREDEVFRIGAAAKRKAIEQENVRPLVAGEDLRDWSHESTIDAIWPYDRETLSGKVAPAVIRFLWPWRRQLSERVAFGKTQLERELHWAEYSMFFHRRYRVPLSIAFAFVATHNHFVLDRGGKVFNRSAPVIKLSEEATVDDHLQLLGLLNSSVACFWMKQVFHCKGSTVDTRGARQTTVPFEDFYEFDGTKLKKFPLVEGSVLALSQLVDKTASRLNEALPESVMEWSVATQQELTDSQEETARLRAQMVWLQEELDWRCIHLYGITDDDLSFPSDQVFELQRGERAFEIALARKIKQGTTETTWFERHDTDPITELPEHWPDWYKQRVNKRLDLIETDRFINLLERPEYKRRWNWQPWETLATEALRNWLKTRLETPRYWPNNEPRSVAQLADIAQTDADFMQVAQLYHNRPDINMVKLITELTKTEAAPYLAAWRYKESGLRKRASWEQTWDLQRRQDSGETVDEIPIPPKYTSADFRTPDIWKLRGKLDVAKERFVSYPGAERAADESMVLGWAGWDHLQQAQALVALIAHRSENEGWDAEQLTPLLAGLAELIPWLQQWHNEHDTTIGQGLGDYYNHYLTNQTQRLGLSPDDLAAWRPPKKKRSRKKKATV